MRSRGSASGKAEPRGSKRPLPPFAKSQKNIPARAPLDWAAVQINRGNTLRVIGEREKGTARLEEAVEAYREALQEYTREVAPRDWATTQISLAAALETLGERESGTARLKAAVEAYRDALQELTGARSPLEWATTQNNLGTALKGPRRAREGHGAARRGRRSPSRSHAGIDPRTGSGPMGRHPAQSRRRLPRRDPASPHGRAALTAGALAASAGTACHKVLARPCSVLCQ